MAKDLGNATISINVSVTGLAKSADKLEKFFDKLSSNISIVNLKLNTLKVTLGTLGNTGTGKLVNGMREAAKAVGKLNSGIKKTDEFIDEAVKSNKNLDDNFKKSKGEVEKLTIELKKSLAVIKQMKSSSRGATPKTSSSNPYGLQTKAVRDAYNTHLSPTSSNRAGGGDPQVAGAVAKVKSQAKASASALRDVSSSLKDAGRQALIFGAILAGIFVPIIKEGAEFEQSVANVASVITGLTNGTDDARTRIKALSDEFQRLGVETEFTASQIGNAARQLALSGFDDTEIRASLEDITNLASATNTELEKTAQIAARITRAFGLSANAFGTVADTLAVITANSNTTLEGIGESFKLASPIAAAYGQSVEDIAVAFGVLGDAGIQNSRAGTGISRLFSELTEKKDDIRTLLESVGASFDDIDPTRKSLLEISKVFGDLTAQGKIDQSDVFELFDQRSARTFVSLINSGSEAVEKLQDELDGAAGAAERIRDFRIETIAGGFKLLTSAAAGAATAITTQLAPAITFVSEKVTNAIRGFTEWTKESEGLVQSISGVAAVVATFAITIGGLFITLGGLASIAALPLFVGALTTAFTVGLPLVVGATIAIGALTTAFVVLGTTITSYVTDIIEAKTGIFELTEENSEFLNVVNQTNNALDSIGDQARKLTQKLELLKKVTSLNTLEFTRLRELNEGGGIFGSTVGEVDREVIKSQFAAIGTQIEVEQAKLAEKFQEKSGGFLRGLFTGAASLVSQNVGGNADDQGIVAGAVFDNTFISAEEAVLIARIEKLEEGRDKLGEVAGEIDKAEAELEIIRKRFATGGFSIQLADTDIKLNNLDKANKQITEDLKNEDIEVTERLRLQKKQIILNKEIKEVSKERDSIQSILGSLTSQEQANLLQAAANAKLEGVGIEEADDNLAKLILNQDKRNAIIEEGVAAKEKIKELQSELDDDDISSDERDVKGIEDTAIRRNTEFTKILEGVGASAEQAKEELKLLNDEKIGAEKVVADDADNTKGQKALKRITEEIENVKSRIRLLDSDAIDAALSLEQVERVRIKQLSEISENRLKIQRDTIRDAQEARAQAEGNLELEIQLFKEKAEARAQDAAEGLKARVFLDSEGKVISDIIELEKKRRQVLEDLARATEAEIASKLKIKELATDILDIEKEANADLLSKQDQEIDKIDDQEKDKLKGLDESIEKLKKEEAALLRQINEGTFTTPDNQAKAANRLASIKANLAREDAARKALEKSFDRKRDKVTKDEAKKKEKFLRESALKAAIRAEDVEEEFRLKRLEGVETINEAIDASNLDAAEKKTERLIRLAELDAQLAEDKDKREQDIAKKADARNKKLDTSGQKTANNLAKERDKVESGILDKLVSQVKTLRDAKTLLGFIARLESARKTKAEREAKLAASAEAKVVRLEGKRAKAVAAGEDTQSIDRSLARARIDLNLANGAAAKSMEAAGGSAKDLARDLQALSNSLKQNAQGRTPTPAPAGQTPPQGPLGVNQGGPVAPGATPPQPTVQQTIQNALQNASLNLNTNGATPVPTTGPITGINTDQILLQILEATRQGFVPGNLPLVETIDPSKVAAVGNTTTIGAIKFENTFNIPDVPREELEGIIAQAQIDMLRKATT